MFTILEIKRQKCWISLQLVSDMFLKLFNLNIIMSEYPVYIDNYTFKKINYHHIIKTNRYTGTKTFGNLKSIISTFLN